MIKFQKKTISKPQVRPGRSGRMEWQQPGPNLGSDIMQWGSKGKGLKSILFLVSSCGVAFLPFW